MAANAEESRGFTELKGRFPKIVPEEHAFEDPLTMAMARQAMESQARQEASKARLAALDPTPETQWQDQVRQRKQRERNLRAEALRAQQEQQAQAEAAAAAALDSAPVPMQQPPSLEAVALSQIEQEYELNLAEKRKQLRLERETAERQVREAQQLVQQNLTREVEAMACEDRAAATFMTNVKIEAQHRSAEPVTLDAATATLIQTLLAARQDYIVKQHELEQQRRQEEAEAQRLEWERQDREYREWRNSVREMRCCRQRLQDCGVPNTTEMKQSPAIDLDAFEQLREQEVKHKALLDDALQRAAADSQRLRDLGDSPRRLLGKARQLAERQKEVREKTDPVKMEQELWDSLLAKNRHARQQERMSKTSGSRWGLCT